MNFFLFCECCKLYDKVVLVRPRAMSHISPIRLIICNSGYVKNIPIFEKAHHFLLNENTLEVLT